MTLGEGSVLKLLFIEDEPDVIKPVVNLIKRRQRETEFDIEIVGFETAEDMIISFSPDIVVPDLLDRGGSAEPKDEGQHTLDFIWNKHFCPVVVYATDPEMCADIYKSHPFVKRVKKGAGSPQALVKEFDGFRPQIEALKVAGELVRCAFSDAMREVAPYAFEAFSDDAGRTRTITRSGRRRVAALMDQATTDGGPLESWEQYLFPPVCDDIQLGDVLRERNKCSDDPSAFRVVLTPSCDLARSGDRQRKVGTVLVARCCPMATGLERVGLKGATKAKLKKLLPTSMLAPGYAGSIVPFPCLKNKIPTMAADMRDLELIEAEEVGPEKAFLQIASIDSPFRELVSWAYLQTACRPGVPDRKLETWRDEIIEDVQE